MAITLAEVKRFHQKTHGLTRAEEIRFYADQLGVSEAVIDQLFDNQKRHVWKYPIAINGETDQNTIWLSELFRELVSRWGSDVVALRDALHRPLTGEEFPRTTPQLLKTIRQGGREVIPDLFQFLQSSVTNGAKPRNSRRIPA